jgi:hypothetical protein
VKRFWEKLHLITWTRDDESPAVSSSLEQLAAACQEGNTQAQKQLFDALSPKMMAL